MIKCDVCGKNSLLPEKFGSVNVCKVCFMKTNGFLWKKQYERYDEAEKQRGKALENAHKLNFPPHVIKAINDFFVIQMDNMKVCECCGQPVQHLEKIGKVKLCKKCFEKINTSAWKKNEYDDNDEVEKGRQKFLKLASENGFPACLIEEINNHFDKKIQRGLICTVRSDKGQKIRVFETHCMLKTNSDFNVEEISAEYGKILKKSQPKETIFGDGAAKMIAKSLLGGGVVKTGIKLAASAAINVAAEKATKPKGIFKVVKGEFKIDYSVYDFADYQKRGENGLGFIRFRKSRSNDPSDDMIFFFYADNKKIDNAYNAICEGILNNQRQIAEAIQTKQPAFNSAADEILKFKNLFDQGIITKEEFELKKKELLGL